MSCWSGKKWWEEYFRNLLDNRESVKNLEKPDYARKAREAK